MPEPTSLYELILLIVFALIGIAVGIVTFFKLYRHLGKSLFNFIISLAFSALVAYCTFWVIPCILNLIIPRWCEGCQEYH